MEISGLEVWSKGSNQTFIFETVKGYGPNQASKQQILQIQTQNISATLTFPSEPFFCGLLTITVSKVQSLNPDHWNIKEVIVFDQNIKIVKNSQFELENLESCTTYRVKTVSKYENITDYFQTLAGNELRKFSAGGKEKNFTLVFAIKSVQKTFFTQMKLQYYHINFQSL